MLCLYYGNHVRLFKLDFFSAEAASMLTRNVWISTASHQQQTLQLPGSLRLLFPLPRVGETAFVSTEALRKLCTSWPCSWVSQYLLWLWGPYSPPLRSAHIIITISWKPAMISSCPIHSEPLMSCLFGNAPLHAIVLQSWDLHSMPPPPPPTPPQCVQPAWSLATPPHPLHL